MIQLGGAGGMDQTNFVKRSVCPSCCSDRRQTLYACDYLAPPVKNYLESFYALQGGVEFDDLSGARYVLDECLDCGLIYQEEIPGDVLLTKLYDRWIAPEKVFGEDDHLVHYADYAQEVMMLIAWLDPAPGSLQVFDFGMGWGRWARIARAFGCNAYGTELSASRITYARSQGINVIAWDEIPAHQFDFINTEQVCEHLAHPLETLRYLAGSLKPGGLIKISVPNGGDFKRQLKVADWTAPKFSKNSLNAAAPLEHINCFNYGALMRMASLTGLEPVERPWPILLRYSLGADILPGMLKNILRIYFKGAYLKRLYYFFRRKAGA